MYRYPDAEDLEHECQEDENAPVVENYTEGDLKEREAARAG
jgi:hypothetical protein